MNELLWYSVRTIYRHDDVAASAHPVFEERVVLFRAESFDNAMSKAQQEAEAYGKGLKGVTFLGFFDCYELPDDTVGDGTEVFSLLRQSELPDDEYLTQFFDTGKEFRSDRL
jgi:hypothetical protein